MSIIDPEGLFNGDRFDDVSDGARLAWPYFWCATNSCGRLEISYRKILSRAFSRFRKPPKEADVMKWIREYSAAFLLFVYVAPDGSTWGQWDTSEAMLPTYKLKADERSPRPPHDEFVKWKESYILRKKAKSFGCSDSKTFQKVSDYIGVGVGVGVGIGVGKNISSPAAPDEGVNGQLALRTLEPPETQPSKASLRKLQDHWFDEDFWPQYWRKVDKKAARTEWYKHAKTEAIKNRICEALKAEAPDQLSRDPEHRPHAATWLHKNRYDDRPDESPPVVPKKSAREQMWEDLAHDRET